MEGGGGGRGSDAYMLRFLLDLVLHLKQCI